MFIHLKSEGNFVVIPVDNIAFVMEQYDNTNAEIFFKNKVDVRPDITVFKLIIP